LPLGCRPGDNDFAFTGGFRLWEKVKPVHDKADKTKEAGT
jgi:hypothetical protein